MATFKSTLVTNAQAVGTFAQLTAAHERGLARVAYVTHEVTTAQIDNADDIILLLPLPSNAILHSLTLYNDDLDSNGSPALACDVGLYYGLATRAGTAADAVVDVDCFGTAITTLQAPNTVGVNVRYEAADINGVGKALYEVGGLSTDPKVPLVIGLDITTASATAAAGTITLVATYTLKGD